MIMTDHSDNFSEQDLRDLEALLNSERKHPIVEILSAWLDVSEDEIVGRLDGKFDIYKVSEILGKPVYRPSRINDRHAYLEFGDKFLSLENWIRKNSTRIAIVRGKGDYALIAFGEIVYGKMDANISHVIYLGGI